MNEPNKINDGGAAFPRKRSLHRADCIPNQSGDKGFIHDLPQDSMTLRDWFAGMALQGILASYAGSAYPKPNFDRSTIEAFKYADAMIAQRTKQP